jgi:hypothetical protein
MIAIGRNKNLKTAHLAKVIAIKAGFVRTITLTA